MRVIICTVANDQIFPSAIDVEEIILEESEVPSSEIQVCVVAFKLSLIGLSGKLVLVVVKVSRGRSRDPKLPRFSILALTVK